MDYCELATSHGLATAVTSLIDVKATTFTCNTNTTTTIREVFPTLQVRDYADPVESQRAFRPFQLLRSKKCGTDNHFGVATCIAFVVGILHQTLGPCSSRSLNHTAEVGAAALSNRHTYIRKYTREATVPPLYVALPVRPPLSSLGLFSLLFLCPALLLLLLWMFSSHTIGQTALADGCLSNFDISKLEFSPAPGRP